MVYIDILFVVYTKSCKTSLCAVLVLRWWNLAWGIDRRCKGVFIGDVNTSHYYKLAQSMAGKYITKMAK